MLRPRTTGFITLLGILVLTLVLAACGETTATPTITGTATPLPTVAANTQTQNVPTSAVTTSAAVTTASNNPTNIATAPTQATSAATTSGQTTATTNTTPTTVATASNPTSAAASSAATTNAVTTAAPANRTTPPVVSPAVTAQPQPSTAAATSNTNAAVSDADAVYQALQKAYQSKGFKLSGSLTQDAKKSTQNFELALPDKLHSATTADDGKITERIIIGNDSYIKAANGGWIRDQTVSLTKQLNGLGLLNPTQAPDLFKKADITKKPDAQVNGETFRVIEVSFSETQTIPEGLPSAPQLNYYLDKNGYIKRITMFNIGNAFTYDLTDYNTPITISPPA